MASEEEDYKMRGEFIDKLIEMKKEEFKKLFEENRTALWFSKETVDGGKKYFYEKSFKETSRAMFECSMTINRLEVMKKLRELTEINLILEKGLMEGIPFKTNDLDDEDKTIEYLENKFPKQVRKIFKVKED